MFEYARGPRCCFGNGVNSKRLLTWKVLAKQVGLYRHRLPEAKPLIRYSAIDDDGISSLV